MCRKCGFQPTCRSGNVSWIPAFLRDILFGLSILAFLVTSADAFVPRNGVMGSLKESVRLSLQVATIMPPADLTPAVDKFARLPHTGFSSSSMISAKGPVPDGPEPFGLVADELQSLSDYVKELLISENPVLTMAASHFFEQVLKWSSSFLNVLYN